ncbi:MAG: hypothetical protein Q9213_002551 [Squamulea squamosa]
MSHRFPPIAPTDLSPDQRVATTKLSQMFGDNPVFKYKDVDGSLMGPYSVLLYTPGLIEPWFGLASAVIKQAMLEPRGKELAVLAVTAVYSAPYILYAHRLVGASVGLSEDEIINASKGRLSESLTESEVVTYTIAYELAEGRGPLSDSSWNRAVTVLGREKTASIAHLVSGYVYTCILLRVGAVGVPE